MKLTVCSLALVLAVQAQAAPSMSAAPPAPSKPPVVAPAAVPAPAPAPTGEFANLKADLKRLMVGNQAGIVKVLGPNREGVAYSRSIDDQQFARLDDDHCHCIFNALGLEKHRLQPTVQHILINYATLPRKECVAFLSAAACSPSLDPGMRDKTEQFLLKVMESDTDVHARRQAILALAVQRQVSPLVAEKVLGIYEKSENLWETFPVQQFFQYHAPQLRRMANFTEMRARVAAVNSLYTPAILLFLDTPEPAPPKPR